MYNCNRCLENNWSFKKVEGIITATCTFCSYEVQFSKKKKPILNKKVQKVIDNLPKKITKKTFRSVKQSDGTYKTIYG